MPWRCDGVCQALSCCVARHARGGDGAPALSTVCNTKTMNDRAMIFTAFKAAETLFSRAVLLTRVLFSSVALCAHGTHLLPWPCQLRRQVAHHCAEVCAAQQWPSVLRVSDLLECEFEWSVLAESCPSGL